MESESGFVIVTQLADTGKRPSSRLYSMQTPNLFEKSSYAGLDQVLVMDKRRKTVDTTIERILAISGRSSF